MSFDSHKNFAYSTVAVAPSPAGSGLALTLQAGGGKEMPTPPFNATVWPSGVRPLASNAEIVRVESISGDAIALSKRGEEGSSARNIIPGDQFADTVTAKTFEDIQNAISGDESAVGVEKSRAEAAEGTIASNLTAEKTSRETSVASEKSRAETAEALKLAKASNLSDLASASTARTNLGLGTAAVEAATAFDAKGAAASAQAQAEGASIPILQKGANSGVMGLTSGGIGAQLPAHHASTHAPGGTDELTVGDLPVAPGRPGQRRLSSIKGGINSWVNDNGGMPLESFGAAWDGVTDDHAKLLEAVEASVELGGVPVLLPHGTGIINETVRIPKNISCRVPIKGIGAKGTVVKLPEATTFLSWAATSAGDTIGNTELYGFTVDGNNVAVEGTEAPVVIGGLANCKSQVNIKDVRLRNIKTINVPALDMASNGRRNVILTSDHGSAGLAENSIEGIDIKYCDFEGGQYGVYISGTSGNNIPVNVRMADLYVGFVKHIISSAPMETGSMAHVHIGEQGWGEGQRILVERIFGQYSGDVGIEMDIGGTVRDCYILNPYNEAYLYAIFNPSTTKSPIVTTLTAEAAAVATSITVSSTTGFKAGEEIAVYGSAITNAETDVRIIKTVTDSTHLELASSLTFKHASGLAVQQIDDMNMQRFVGENLRSKRTVASTGGRGCLLINNVSNPLPMGHVDIDGLKHSRATTDVVEAGELVKCQTGSAGNATGNPKSLKVRKIEADISGVQYGGSGLQNVWPVYLSMKGPDCPVTLEGEIKYSGTATGAGGFVGRLVHTTGSCVATLDLDLITQFNVPQTNGQNWSCVFLQEGGLGSVSARVRLRAKSSVGGTEPSGVRTGKAGGFASQLATTTIKNGAELAAGTTVIPVNSTVGFAIGQRIVVDATSATKAEVLLVSSLVANTSLTVSSVGETPGTVLAHPDGATVAVLRSVLIEDSDLSGLVVAGKIVAAEDTGILGGGLIVKNSVLPKPLEPIVLSIPASTKAFVVNQPYPGNVTVEGGTVTAVEVSPDGKAFFKSAGATGAVTHINGGDVVKSTWSIEPTVKYVPDR